MIYLLYTVHILVCFFLILVVLLQQGKGADLSVFGGGATQAAFGSRGAVSLLHKLTVWSFVAFIFTTVSISFATSTETRSSVLSDVPAAEESEAAEAEPAEGRPTGAESESESSPAAPAGDESAAESDGATGQESGQAGEDGSDG